jgi:hypothetical protein
MQSFVPQYLAKSRAGTLPPNALDTKDPNIDDQPGDGAVQAHAVAAHVGLCRGGRRARWRHRANITSAHHRRRAGPAALGGIAALQYNKTSGQWRDQTSGKIYDAKGNEIAR